MQKRNRQGFTLIELLVVIAIIAILAAILFPVFAQARNKARQTADLSNMKQMGIAIMSYKQDYDETFPPAYYYKNDNDATGGYVHWSGMVQPYVKNIGIFVSPGDADGGAAPTNYLLSDNNQGYGAPAGQTPQYNVQDDQAPRLSYSANSNVLPRKRRTVDPAQVVSDGLVDAPANEILITSLTSSPGCIADTSVASGAAFKSHRSTNAFSTAASGQATAKWAGEVAADYTNPVYAVQYTQITTPVDIFDTCAKAAAGSANPYVHLTYTAPRRFSGGSNYTFADGHAKWYRLDATLNPTAFLWGTKLHPGDNKPILNPADGQPVR